MLQEEKDILISKAQETIDDLNTQLNIKQAELESYEAMSVEEPKTWKLGEVIHLQTLCETKPVRMQIIQLDVVHAILIIVEGENIHKSWTGIDVAIEDMGAITTKEMQNLIGDNLSMCRIVKPVGLTNNELTAETIVNDIIEDILYRKGIKHEFYSIDDDIKVKMRNKWKDIIMQHITKVVV